MVVNDLIFIMSIGGVVIMVFMLGFIYFTLKKKLK